VHLEAASIAPVPIWRTANGFSSEGFNLGNLFEVFFDSWFQIGSGNWVQKFFLKRDLDLVASIYERRVDKLKVRVWVCTV
jgi:hypothetical protein